MILSLVEGRRFIWHCIANRFTFI